MSTDPVRVSPYASGDNLHVVIEPPSGSRWEYTWDPDARASCAGKMLPLGMLGALLLHSVDHLAAILLVEETKQ